MPALPLDEAGKYVAGAYVAFLALLLLYVAIMAARIQRIDREARRAAKSRRNAAIVLPQTLPGGRGARRNARGEAEGKIRAGAERPAGGDSVSELLRSGSRTRPRRWSCASGLPSPRAGRSGCSANWSSATRCSRSPRSRPATEPSSTCTSATPSAPSRSRSGCSRGRPGSAHRARGSPVLLRATAAAEHLLRVTAGLDSMIIGEAEVQGQVKRAYELALVEGATGPVLNHLFRSALAAGKRARTEIWVSRRSLSVPSVAVDLAQRTLGGSTTAGCWSWAPARPPS